MYGKPHKIIYPCRVIETYKEQAKISIKLTDGSNMVLLVDKNALRKNGVVILIKDGFAYIGLDKELWTWPKNILPEQ